MGFPGGSVLKNLPASAGDAVLIPGSGRSLGKGNGNPFQYFCLGNPMDRGAWWATVHAVERVGHNLAIKQQFFTRGLLARTGRAFQCLSLLRKSALGGSSSRFCLPRKTLPLGLHFSIHPFIPKEAGASNWLRPQCLTLSLPFPLRAHLRHQPTSLFPFSLALVETLDSATQTRAASRPGWAKTSVLRGRPGPRPLRKEACGGWCLEKQVVWDTPGWSV